MRTTVSFLVAVCLLALPAVAQISPQAARTYDGVGLDQHLGERVPPDLVFRNEEGQRIELGTYMDGSRPVLLTFVYHTCPMLCSALLDGLTRTLEDVDFVPGESFELVTVSFSERDTPEMAAQQKEKYLRRLAQREADWHFLTGDSAAIAELTARVGFRFRWVEEQQEFVHPAALVFLGGDGTITRYLSDLAPRSRDVRACLVEASEGSIGTLLDQAFLYCFQYDPTRNSYVLSARRAMKIGGLLTLAALLATLCMLWRRELRTVSA